MLRILVVNPNTDPQATEAIRTEAARAASFGVAITAVTVARGPRRIVTADDTAAQAPVVVEAIAQRADAIDAAVIAAFSDPGLDPAQRQFAFPVTGIGEASMLAAARIGRFSLVTTNAANRDLYRAAAARYGVADRLAAIRIIAETGADRSALAQAAVAACAATVAEDGAEAVVIAGGPLAGLAAAIQPKVCVPLVDGVAAAVAHAERLVRAGRAG